MSRSASRRAMQWSECRDRALSDGLMHLSQIVVHAITLHLMNNMRVPGLRTDGAGQSIAIVGDIYRFLATGDETDGKYALWEAVVAPGGGPPPHTHSREEEGFYVLDGEITFQVGDRKVT